MIEVFHVPIALDASSLFQELLNYVLICLLLDCWFYSFALEKRSYGTNTSDIKRITGRFRSKLGHGGFDNIYKGSLANGSQVAVNVLNELKVSGEDFINEVESSPLKGLKCFGLLGGFLADAKLGSYLVVAVFASIATVGVTLLTLATSIRSIKPHKCDPRKGGQCIEAIGQQLALLYTSLYILALDGGGIKSNIFEFGSD
ncbi:hypothetical protein CQW23_13925 [Capsicum baccatum]|uniref:Uncharacterized protein n=1 Tax=Capsicum baccatum TaxID=33114 RepID=A0A2G2WHN8_CAPBA|nr:hypothetical protein CQW23_13925 [Capsicum baccatum]